MVIKRLTCILIIIFFNLLGYFSLKAENTVSVSDTIIPRGEIYSIPVNGIIEADRIDSIELEFEFNPFVIDIKSVDIQASYQLNSSAYTYYTTLTTEKGVLNIKIVDIGTNLINSGLFDIGIEGLVSFDSITEFKPTKLLINNIPAQFKAGNAIIKVPGEPIFQKYPEGLFTNFPNPFRGTTTFPFNIENKSTAKFELYSSLGNRIFDESDIKSRIKIIQVIKDGSNKEIKDLSQDLDPGKYYLIFTGDESVLASGHLIMVMKTNKDNYSKSFLFLK